MSTTRYSNNKQVFSKVQRSNWVSTTNVRTNCYTATDKLKHAFQISVQAQLTRGWGERGKEGQGK